MRLNRLERDMYLASRTIGDVQAAKKGRLPQRLAKRWYHRQLIALLRSMKVW